MTTKFERISDGIEVAMESDHALFRVALTGGERSKSGKTVLTANSHGFQSLPGPGSLKFSLMVARPI